MTETEMKLAAQAARWKYVLNCEEEVEECMFRGNFLSSVVDVLEYASVEYEEEDVDKILEYIDKHFISISDSKM